MRLNHQLLPMIDYHKAKELHVGSAQRRLRAGSSATGRPCLPRSAISSCASAHCSTRARKPWRTIWLRCWSPCAARAATPKTSSS